MAKKREDLIEKKPHWFNKREMAASIGIAANNFDKWGVEPVAKRGREIFYDVKTVLNNRLEHFETRLDKKVPAKADAVVGDQNSILYQELRLKKESADKLELQNAVKRGELVPIELFRLVLSRFSPELAAYIDTIPLQIKKKHAGLDSYVIDDIKYQCVKAQNKMSRLDDLIEEIIDEYCSNEDTD